jgi:hypothetical protein
MLLMIGDVVANFCATAQIWISVIGAFLDIKNPELSPRSFQTESLVIYYVFRILTICLIFDLTDCAVIYYILLRMSSICGKTL